MILSNWTKKTFLRLLIKTDGDPSELMNRRSILSDSVMKHHFNVIYFIIASNGRGISLSHYRGNYILNRNLGDIIRS